MKHPLLGAAAIAMLAMPAAAQVIPVDQTPEMADRLLQEGYLPLADQPGLRLELECRAYLAVSFPNGFIEPAYLNADVEATFVEAGRRGGVFSDTIYEYGGPIARRVGELMTLSNSAVDIESGLQLQFLYEELETFVCAQLPKG